MIRLKSMRILRCFGFDDSSIVDIETHSNFVYLLGRNSSGKTSFLQAVRHLESGLVPKDYKNFENFNPVTSPPAITACFVGDFSGLSVDKVIGQVVKDLERQQVPASEQQKNATLIKIFDEVQVAYEELFADINAQGEVWVTKDPDGNYRFQVDLDDQKRFNARQQKIRSAIERAFPQGVFVNSARQKKAVNYSAALTESLVFLQFPPIVFFGDAHPLGVDLPDRITESDLHGGDNPLFVAFLKLLDVDKLQRFFLANDPDERQGLLEEFEAIATKLSSSINSASGNFKTVSLVKLMLHEKNGLQITVSVDGKKSFYRHLSENTKALVAYHVYSGGEDRRRRVLLFDEPNVGFHSTAQRFLLEFLKGLASEGNQVLVSTHSEHMIDLDLLGGVRLLTTDNASRPRIRNHPFQRARSAGDHLALQPILDSIGLRYGSQLNLDGNAVLTEGVTDLMYIRAFARIFGQEVPPLAPARSDAHINTRIPFFISQGIGLKIIIDKGAIKEKIRQAYNFSDDCMFEVPVPLEFQGRFRRSGIEDLFSKSVFGSCLSGQGLGSSEASLIYSRIVPS